MNAHAKAIMIVLAIALVALPLTAEGVYAPATDEEEPTPPTGVSGEITVYGYVTNLSDQEENTPLQNVNVTLYLGSTGTPVETLSPNHTSTDSTGRFEFTFEYDPLADYYLSFDYPGYTVRSLPDLDMMMDEEGHVHFDVRPDMEDGDGNYALTGTADGPHAIVMVITTGTIYGTVMGTSEGDSFELGGATVTIVSQNGQSYSTTTNSTGYFQIECPYGTYMMTVHCNGFQDSGRTEVVSGENTPYTVELVQNTSQVFFGLDIAHAVMLFGLILLVIIVAATAGIYHVSKRKDSEMILNDLEEIVKQDDDDVRRP